MPDVIVLKGAEYAIEVPQSPSVAIEVWQAYSEHGARALGAAIGVCCPRAARQIGVGTLAQARYDVLTYGGAVFDGLLAHGATATEVRVAGSECLLKLNALIPSAEDIDADKDFSEPTP